MRSGIPIAKGVNDANSLALPPEVDEETHYGLIAIGSVFEAVSIFTFCFFLELGGHANACLFLVHAYYQTHPSQHDHGILRMHVSLEYSLATLLSCCTLSTMSCNI
jgi:hypothetical protein